jgi:hypothetical protein
MLSSVLAFLTCATFTVSDPLQSPAQMPTNQAPVEVGTYVTSTALVCRNFSNFDHLLVFGRAGVSSTVTVVLHGGASVRYDFAPEALPGVFVEVVAVRSSVSLATSGTLVLAPPAGSVDESFWFVPGVLGLVTWQQNGCNVIHGTPLSSMLPLYLGAIGPGDGSANCMIQAPIAVPTGGVITGGVPKTPLPM